MCGRPGGLMIFDGGDTGGGRKGEGKEGLAWVLGSGRECGHRREKALGKEKVGTPTAGFWGSGWGEGRMRRRWACNTFGNGYNRGVPCGPQPQRSSLQ